jgi:hypothetical protein
MPKYVSVLLKYIAKYSRIVASVSPSSKLVVVKY